jgi:hypothetical protein
MQYRQAGGPNDLAFRDAIVRDVQRRSHTGAPIDGAVDVALLACVLLVPLVALVVLATGEERPQRGRMPQACFWACALSLASSAFLYVRGRTDAPHAAFFVPAILAGIAIARPRLGSARFAVAVAAGLGFLRWGIAFATLGPPSAVAVANVDAWYRTEGPPRVAAMLAETRGGTGATIPAVVMLPWGSPLYFYADPPPTPPLDVLFPSSNAFNAPWEYVRMASYLDATKTPFVVLDRRFSEAFHADPSPLGTVLRARYKVLFDAPAGLVLARLPE